MPQKRSIIRRYDEAAVPLALLVRLFLGGFFIYMGLAKIDDPVAFLKQIRLYGLLPETPPYFLNGTAIVLPWLEVLCGGALVLGIFRRGASAWLAIMLCIFTPAIFLRALGVHQTEGTPFFQIAFDCGCGGGPEIIWIKLLKNSGLLLIVLATLFSRSCRFSLVSLFVGRPRPASLCRQCSAPIDEGIGELCPTCRNIPASGVATPDPAA